MSDNNNKIVVAPKLWFVSTEMDTKDLIPNSWNKDVSVDIMEK